MRCYHHEKDLGIIGRISCKSQLTISCGQKDTVEIRVGEENGKPLLYYCLLANCTYIINITCFLVFKEGIAGLQNPGTETK